MDSFARLMMREGVTPGTGKGAQKSAVPAKQETNAAHAPERQPETNFENPATFAYSWAMGSEARKTAQAAIDRLTTERMSGKKAWLTIIRDNGSALTVERQMPLSEIIARADRDNIRLITMGGEGWTAIFHPLMGTATIEQDPQGEPE